MGLRISVVGGGTITDEETDLAAAVGREIAARGHTVVCGGRGGTMAAVCRGAKSDGGETIGILPSDRREQANAYVDTAIATGLGHARNVLVPMNGDGVIALAGSHGTLTEIGFASIYDRPIVGLGTHELPDLEIETVETPRAAVTALEDAIDR